MQKIRIRLNEGGVMEYDPNTHSHIYLQNETQQERVQFIDQPEQTREQYDKLLAEYLQAQVKFECHSQLMVGMCVITNKCNMDCTFCYARKNSEDQEYEFDLGYIKHLKTVLPPVSFNSVVFSGGEPFIYFDKVKQLRQEFNRCNIYTNGALVDESVVEWLLETDTSIYVTLDFDIPGFEGHDSREVRGRLQRLVEKYPKFKQIMSLGTVMPIDRLNELDVLREQQAPFESDCWRLYNFVPPADGSTFTASKEVFEHELDLLEYDQVTIKESFFFRYINYVQKMATEGFNSSSCSNSLTVNHRGQIYACQEYASMPEKFSELRFKPIDVYNFSPEVFAEHVSGYKYGPNSLCTKDCNMRYLCGGVCWANIEHNRYLCEFSRYAIAYAMYLKYNYIPVNNRLAATVPLRPYKSF